MEADDDRFDGSWQTQCTSLLHCVDDNGDLDDHRYSMFFKYKRQKRLNDIETTIEALTTINNDDSVTSNDDDNGQNDGKNDNNNRRVRTKRSIFRREINKMRDPVSDEIVEVTPKMSVWYQTNVCNPDLENPKFNNRF